jgi:hypothetical protein
MEVVHWLKTDGKASKTAVTSQLCKHKSKQKYSERKGAVEEITITMTNL